MKKDCKLWLSITVAAVAVFNVLFYYAVHSMWSGIIAILGAASPYVIMAIIFLVAVAAVLMLFFNKRRLVPTIILAAATVFFLAVECYIVSQTYDCYMYFLREFAISLGYLAIFAVIVFVLFFFFKTKPSQWKWLKTAVCFVLIFVFFFAYFDIGVNSFTSTPVVYAVGEDYQIVFTTAIKGTAWVKVGGVEYNDSYNGSRISEQKVHKITVPQEALDNAGGYEIFTRAMFLRGPYSACQGRTLTKNYNWRGVDSSDGLNYYVFSDTHMTTKAVTKAAGYFGDKLDFLVCTGDTASWLDRPMDAEYILKIAGAVTGGEIPVVYARGNHETKGLIANEFHRYVGAVGEDFYFTFRLKNVWGVVLDVGEDHADDWSEFYDSSRFDEYRAAQVEFLDEIIANKDTEYDAEGVDYRIALCHFPITFVYNDDHAETYKREWVSRLNEMKLTALFGGHRHQLMIVQSDWAEGTELYYHKAYAGYDSKKTTGSVLEANFPMFLVSRKTETQAISVKDTNRYFTGMAVSVSDGKTTLSYTDQDHNKLDVVSPWFADIHYGTDIVLDNK